MARILYQSCHAIDVNTKMLWYYLYMPKGFKKDGTKLGFRKGHTFSKKSHAKQSFFCPCGKEFFLTPSQIRPKHGKYCSRNCYYKFRINFDVSNLSHILKGSTHWNYKGDKAGYKALHLRVNQIRGKALVCEECGSQYWTEWANITGNYADIWDYKVLCRKCHNKFDDIAQKSANTRKKTSNEASNTKNITEGGGLEA